MCWILHIERELIHIRDILREGACLIGNTGFVGSNLARAFPFGTQVNSSSISTIRGRRFDLVVCAAPHAQKWRANQHPAHDRAQVDGLIDSLRDINAERFVLVSTIDVFPRLTEIDDGFRGPWTPNHPYGANRKLVEDFAQNRWEQCTVVRIPGLFGPGLKKNLIYDLMNDRLLHDIHPEGILQWYDIGRLWGDVLTVMSAGIESILLATEPVRTGEIAARFFPRLLIGSDASGPPHSDVRTIHGGLFGGRDAYRLTASEVLDDLAAFLAAEEAHPGTGR